MPIMRFCHIATLLSKETAASTRALSKSPGSTPTSNLLWFRRIAGAGTEDARLLPPKSSATRSPHCGARSGKESWTDSLPPLRFARTPIRDETELRTNLR
jgi:hypothetical protein